MTVLRSRIEGTRAACIGQSVAYCETGDEYISFCNCGFTKEQCEANLVSEVHSYLLLHQGLIYWRRLPEVELFLCYGEGGREFSERNRMLPTEIWRGSCRLVATEKPLPRTVDPVEFSDFRRAKMFK